LEGELESLHRRESVLIELQVEMTRTREATKEARERADVLREHARLVTRPDGEVAQRLADLLPLATAINKELDEAAAAEAEATQRVERAASAVAAAAEVGESVEDLAAAAELLRSVRQALTDLEAADLPADQEQSELDAALAALEADEAALPELEAASQVAGEAASTAIASLERQRELGRQVREALRAARESAAACATAAAEEQRLREAMPGLEEEFVERRRLAHEAESALEVRRRTLEEAQRRDAVAHAAEGVGPGDPCPVCGRRLAQDFQPSSSGALRPMRQALKDADAELTRRRAAETTAATQLVEGGRRLAEAVSRRKAIESTARIRLEGLHLVAPAADLGFDEAVVLRPIDDRALEFEAKATGTGQAVEQARGRLLAAQADLEARRTDHGRRVSRFEREKERVRDQRARCEQRLRTLPRALAVEKVACAIDLDEAIAATGQRLDEAKRQRAELDDMQGQVARLARVRSGQQRRLQDDVERPPRPGHAKRHAAVASHRRRPQGAGASFCGGRSEERHHRGRGPVDRGA
jgi:DNA repair protein SbcC/Rad50